MIPKATKSQESNILVKPKKTTSKNFIIKCLNLPIFKGLKLVYLINWLHLVDFSCWDQKFYGGGGKGKNAFVHLIDLIPHKLPFSSRNRLILELWIQNLSWL